MTQQNKISIDDLVRLMAKPFKEWGWVFNEAQVEMLYPMVSQFSTEAIDQAAKHLLRESKYKPKPAEIIAACAKFTKGNGDPSKSFIERLEAKEAASKAKVDNYTAQFMEFNDLATQAKAQGWELDLERFVALTADTMQQMIDAPRGYGWTSQAVPRHLVYVYRDLLKAAYPRIKSSEIIDVLTVLPDMAVPYWEAQGMREKPPATPTSKSFEAHCNAIVARLKAQWTKQQDTGHGEQLT